jgi:hypothetical protein
VTEHKSIINWAADRLVDAGYARPDQTELIVETPHSLVMRICAGDKVFYLKQTPALLYVEALILQELADTDAVPLVVAADQELRCFLMPACGEESLRTRFAGMADWDFMCKGIRLYKSVQDKAVAYIEDFSDKGVPDWRFSKLPDLYRVIVEDTEYLHRCGLSDEDIGALQERMQSFSAVCADLAQMGLRDTINHSDFQENNILVSNTGKLSIIDWGEVGIGNPLLSLMLFLVKAGSRYKAGPGDVAYQKMEDCIFEGFNVEDREHIVQQIKVVLPIYYILTLRNVEQATDQTTPVWNERAGGSFKMFLNDFPPV